MGIPSGAISLSGCIQTCLQGLSAWSQSRSSTQLLWLPTRTPFPSLQSLVRGRSGANMIFIPTSGWGKARVYGDIWEPRKILIGFAELAVPVSLCNMGIISQFYRITEKLRLEGTPGHHGVQAPCSKQQQQEQAAQDCVQVWFEYLHKQRCHNLSGQPFPLPESEKVSSYV